MLRRQSVLFSLPAPTCKTAPPHTSRSYPSTPRPAFSARPQRRRSLPATPRRAETSSGYDNVNVRTREPRLGKGRRHARLSAGMLVHSNQVGEGKERLCKLAQQTKLPRQTGRREDQAVGLGGVMFAEIEAFAVEDGVPAAAAADGI